MRGSGPDHGGKMRRHNSDRKAGDEEVKLSSANEGKFGKNLDRMLLTKSNSAFRREERLNTADCNSVTLLVDLLN